MRRIGFSDVVYFVVGAAAAPFAVVGLARVIPVEWPLYGPFLVVLVVAAVLWIRSLRSLAVGLAMGTAGFAAFLYYVLTEFERGLRGLD